MSDQRPPADDPRAHPSPGADRPPHGGSSGRGRGDEPLPEPDLGPLVALLGDPAVWEEPSAGLDDAIVTAIHREMVAPPPAPAGGDPTVVAIERRRRRWVAPALSAIAAAVVVVAAFALAARLADDGDAVDHEVALAGTELAPSASAVAEVTATPQGTRIVLDVRDLPPAPEGRYYEAWLRQDPEVGVSAGTFHLRGGDAAIELWSGVTVDEYPLITVTLQTEGEGAASSGRVVLRGSVRR